MHECDTISYGAQYNMRTLCIYIHSTFIPVHSCTLYVRLLYFTEEPNFMSHIDIIIIHRYIYIIYTRGRCIYVCFFVCVREFSLFLLERNIYYYYDEIKTKITQNKQPITQTHTHTHKYISTNYYLHSLTHTA